MWPNTPWKNTETQFQQFSHLFFFWALVANLSFCWRPMRYLWRTVFRAVTLWHRLQTLWIFLIQSSSNHVPSFEGFRPAALDKGSLIICQHKWNLGRTRQLLGSSWHRSTYSRSMAFPTTLTCCRSSWARKGGPLHKTSIVESASQTRATIFLHSSGGGLDWRRSFKNLRTTYES